MDIQTEPFRKATGTVAAEIAGRLDLSAGARARLVPGLSPQAFLSILVKEEMIGDAVRFMAFLLPVREAIWWGCLVTHSLLPTPTPLERASIERAAAWVYEPGDAVRRACMELAEQGRFDGAAAYLCLSVFWSGGSMAPEGQPEVVPDPSLGPIGAGATVLLALSAGDPRTLPDRFRLAMIRAVNIANGGNGWLADDRPINADATGTKAPEMRG